MVRGIQAVLVIGALAASAAPTRAELSVQIENLQSAGGFSFTPFWLGFHDNNFNVFDAGTSAGTPAGITSIAELGDTGPLSGRFGTEQADGFDTTFADVTGPPVFSPGESATLPVNVGDATRNRYFNFASMVVPSNDLFVGNDDALQIFDAGGAFLGPFTIELYGADVWDNGSEVNDITDGPAFVEGIDGTLGTDENGVIRPFFTVAGDDAYIASIIGTTTAPGPVISQGFDSGTLLGRITITPEPGAIALLALAAPILRRTRGRRGA